MNCSAHRDTPVLLICGSCNNTPVCTDCMTGEHIGHRFVKPEELIQNSSCLLERRVSDNKQLITELQSDLDEIKSQKQEQKSHSNDVDRHIEAQRLSLHGVVDCIAQDLKNINQLELDNNLETLKEQEKNITDHLNLSNIYDRDVTNVLNSQNSFHIIKAVKDFPPLTSNRMQQVFPNKLEFWKGEENLRCLQELFGGVVNKPADAESGCDFLDEANRQGVYVDNGDYLRDGKHGRPLYEGNTVADNTPVSDSLELISEFKTSNENLSSIIPSTPGKCWVKCFTKNKMTLFDTNGHKSNTVKFNTSVCGVTNSSDLSVLYACGKESQMILKISVDKRVESTYIFSTAPLYPCGLAHISSGDHIVILSPLPVLSYQNSCTIIKYSPNGEVLARCNNNAFGLLGRIRVNTSEDTIIVTNKTGDRFCYLMLLNPDFTIRMSYFGDGKTLSGEYDLHPETRYQPFSITDVCVDHQDNILICDRVSRAIEILSLSCNRLLHFELDRTHTPRAISVNGHGIWIGCMSGKVLIYKKP